MRIRPFEYHTGTGISEVLLLLAKYGADAKVVAGGTDIVLAIEHKTILLQGCSQFT